MKLRRLEIDFPIHVEVTSEQLHKLSSLASEICRANEPEDQMLWPSEEGFKVTYMPMTAEDEKHRGMEFDSDTYHIGCFMREAYPEEIERKRARARK